jgi:hypothetical protein
MTYNFDPDAWLKREKALLEKRRDAGEIEDDDFERALEELEERHRRMWERLDGTFRIPE